MQQVGRVEAELLEIIGELRGTIDVAVDDMKARDACLAERLLVAARHLVDVGAHHHQRMLIQHAPPRGLLLHNQ